MYHIYVTQTCQHKIAKYIIKSKIENNKYIYQRRVRHEYNLHTIKRLTLFLIQNFKIINLRVVILIYSILNFIILHNVRLKLTLQSPTNFNFFFKKTTRNV